jgi:hypothetical protein
MNDARLLDRLAEANAYAPTTPLPDEIWTCELSLREIERRLTMKPTELTERSASREDSPPRRRYGVSRPLQRSRSSGTPGRRGFITAAVALLVVFAGIGIWMSTAGESDVTAGDALAAGNGFVEAFNRGDAEAALAFLGPEAAISQTFIGMSDGDDGVSQAFFERELAWYTAQGGEYTDPRCSAAEPSLPSAPTLTVLCEFGLHGAAERAAGKGPVSTDLTIVVGPNGIEELAYVYPPSFGVGPFDEWVALNHPENAVIVEYGDWASVEQARLGGSLIPGYAAAWLADLAERGCSYFREIDSVRCASADPAEVAAAVAVADTYIAAFNAGDSDSVLDLVTPDAVFAESYVGMTDGADQVGRPFFEQRLAWETAQGTSLLSPECVEQEADASSVTVSCSLGWLTARLAAVEADPVPTTLTIRVTDAGIAEIGFEHDPTFGIAPFDDWVQLNHPEDAGIVEFGDWGSVEEARLGGSLIPVYVQEWLAEIAAEGCTYDHDLGRVSC